MKIMNYSLGIGLSLMSFAVFAEEEQTAVMDLAGLKEKCVELSGNQQLKPFSAAISCTSKTTFWKTMDPSADQKHPTFKMKNELVYGVSGKMKSLQMPYQTYQAEIAQTEVPCILLEQWTRTVPAIQVELSCEKIAEVKSFVDLCKSVIDTNLTENPSLALDEKTNQLFNSCENPAALIQKSNENEQ